MAQDSTDLIGFVRNGDTVLIHSMNRLARNLDDLKQIIGRLTKKGVRVEFVKEALTSTGDDNAAATFLLHVIGVLAEFERSLIGERQREGIALAKQRKVYTGRTPALDAVKAAALRRRASMGESKTALARSGSAGQPSTPTSATTPQSWHRCLPLCRSTTAHCRPWRSTTRSSRPKRPIRSQPNRSDVSRRRVRAFRFQHSSAQAPKTRASPCRRVLKMTPVSEPASTAHYVATAELVICNPSKLTRSASAFTKEANSEPMDKAWILGHATNSTARIRQFLRAQP